jgi:uncharacterized membrane protein
MSSERALDRLVNLTDAVVAVAITLLVLSVVDIRAEPGQSSIWDVLAANGNQVFAFVLTFLVVAAMWQVHNRILNGIVAFDGTIFRLNLLWLFGIVLLPWPSALYGENIGAEMGNEGYLQGAGVFYWGTLVFINIMANMIGWHIVRHPELVNPDAKGPSFYRQRGMAFLIAFVLLGIASVVFPQGDPWLPLLLIPLTIVFGRRDRKTA